MSSSVSGTDETQDRSCCCSALENTQRVLSSAYARLCRGSGKASRQVLPYDNTRDHNVSLRELYGHTTEQEGITVTWVTGDASSETSSTSNTDDHAGHNILADGAESSGFSFCSKDYEQQGGLAKLHAISTGNTNAPLSQNEQYANSHSAIQGTCDQPAAYLQEKVRILQTDKSKVADVDALSNIQALLQAEAAGLQQQLTWLQSHASLQDNINQDLMAEVVHLRAALAALSAAPPQQP